MATTATPYGLRPVKRTDGMPYAGATSQYLIDPAGEATNLFYGQVVIIGADGYIALSTATGADITTNNLGGNGVGAIGVFVGCEYVNSSGQLVQAQYYPSGTANGGTIKAYVVDDPNVLFQAQLDGAGAQTSSAPIHSLLQFSPPRLVLPRQVTRLQHWMPPSKPQRLHSASLLMCHLLVMRSQMYL
jgi:hypothetical protein